MGEPGQPRKYTIGNRVTVSIARERGEYLEAHGKLVTESLKDFTRINLAKSLIAADKVGFTVAPIASTPPTVRSPGAGVWGKE